MRLSYWHEVVGCVMTTDTRQNKSEPNELRSKSLVVLLRLSFPARECPLLLLVVLKASVDKRSPKNHHFQQDVPEISVSFRDGSSTLWCDCSDYAC